MQLRDITMSDLSLYVSMLTDPRMMSELGGPLAMNGLEDKLRGIVREVRQGSVWYSVIVTDEGVPAGSVCIWEHEQDGPTISEIGWMVLPQFQGRGLATAAVRAILDRASAVGRWNAIHAFPGVTNEPSNAICRRLGFRHVGDQEIEYAGRTLRCNHWVLDRRALSRR